MNADEETFYRYYYLHNFKFTKVKKNESVLKKCDLLTHTYLIQFDYAIYNSRVRWLIYVHSHFESLLCIND